MLARKGCGHASEMIVDASGASSEEEGNLVFGQYMPIRGRSKRSRKEEEEEEEEEEEKRTESGAWPFWARVTGAVPPRRGQRLLPPSSGDLVFGLYMARAMCWRGNLKRLPVQ